MFDIELAGDPTPLLSNEAIDATEGKLIAEPRSIRLRLVVSSRPVTSLMGGGRIIKWLHRFSSPPFTPTFLLQKFPVEPLCAVQRRWNHRVQVFVKTLLESFELQFLGLGNGPLEVPVDQLATAVVLLFGPQLTQVLSGLSGALSCFRRGRANGRIGPPSLDQRTTDFRPRCHSVVHVSTDKDIVQSLLPQANRLAVFDRA
jgi:hypothetical protein